MSNIIAGVFLSLTSIYSSSVNISIIQFLLDLNLRLLISVSNIKETAQSGERKGGGTLAWI